MAENKRRCLTRGNNTPRLHGNGVGDNVWRYIDKKRRARLRDTRNFAPLLMSLHASDQLYDLFIHVSVLGTTNPRLEQEVEALRVDFVGGGCC